MPKISTDEFARRLDSLDFISLSGFLPNPDPVLKRLGQDMRVYRELLAHPNVAGLVRRLRESVRSMEWSIERGNAPARIAKSLQSMFDALDIKASCASMVDAALFGYQPIEVMWSKIDGEFRPTDLIPKPPEWFVFGPENAELRFLSRAAPANGEEVPDMKFLLPRQDATYQNPYGFPSLSACFWPVSFIKGNQKFWLSFNEKLGGSWVIGHMPRGTSKADRQEMLEGLEDMIQDAVAVVADDNDGSVQIIQAGDKSGTADTFERFIMMCRSEIAIALVGQNQTTEATANLASSRSGLEVSREIRDGLVAMIEAEINRLIIWIARLNYPSASELPKFMMWEQEEVDEGQARRDEILAKAGLRLSAAYFRRAYDLTDEDIEGVGSPASGASPPPAEFAEGDYPLTPTQAASEIAAGAESVGKHWEDIVGPMLDEILEKFRETADYDDFLEKIEKMKKVSPHKKVQEILARAGFAAALIGEVQS